jgi:hypothetical protein
MKFNILQGFDMKELLSNLDWPFEISEYEISPRNNNSFFILQSTINYLFLSLYI